MFSEVIVGVDDRGGGRDGIPLAKTLMAPSGKLTLASVLTSDPFLYRGASAAVAEAERTDAIKLLETARNRAGIEADLRCEWWPSVGRGLHEIVEELSGDLLVVGSSSRGVLGRVLIGDDTHASLNGARCAVAIAPAGYGDGGGPIREVGVGYDGSPESEAALDVARTIAREHGARLSACQAVSIPTTALGPGYAAAEREHRPGRSGGPGAAGSAWRGLTREPCTVRRPSQSLSTATRWICSSLGHGATVRWVVSCTGAPARGWRGAPAARCWCFRVAPCWRRVATLRAMRRPWRCRGGDRSCMCSSQQHPVMRRPVRSPRRSQAGSTGVASTRRRDASTRS